MSPALHDRILSRLASTGADQHSWSFLIPAALDGPEALRTYLTGTSTPAPTSARVPAPSAEPPGICVSSISVEGFRGIGPSATLPLQPGPGLTLVVGRNGSGKSSFAEGLELLLTGHNQRWDGKKSRDWARGWRNLHQPASTTVSAGLVVEGLGPMTARRTWAADADVTMSQTELRDKAKKARPLDALGWTSALTTFRPFLSYNELGSILDDGPSKAYDALAPVLGLDEFVQVQQTLNETRKAWATLGFVLERTGRPEDALSALERAVTLEPDNWRHQVRLALGSWGETRLRAARAALKRCPQLPLAHWPAATVFVARHALDQAERDVDLGLAVA